MLVNFDPELFSVYLLYCSHSLAHHPHLSSIKSNGHVFASTVGSTFFVLYINIATVVVLFIRSFFSLLSIQQQSGILLRMAILYYWKRKQKSPRETLNDCPQDSRVRSHFAFSQNGVGCCHLRPVRGVELIKRCSQNSKAYIVPGIIIISQDTLPFEINSF